MVSFRPTCSRGAENRGGEGRRAKFMPEGMDEPEDVGPATICRPIREGVGRKEAIYTLRRLRGRQPLWACGVTSRIPMTSRPAAWSERIAVSRPDPGPLTNTSTRSSPWSMPLRAAASAVTWAANGVDLREPLKPAPPADSHAMTLPSRSVRETIVLLNEVLMCACPTGMFFLGLRRPRWGRLGAGIGYFFTAFFLPATCMRFGPL